MRWLIRGGVALVVILLFMLLLRACGGDDDGDGLDDGGDQGASSTTNAAGGSDDAASTTIAPGPTTTEDPTDDAGAGQVPSTTTPVEPTTTGLGDGSPPEAPSNVACRPGAGSGEFVLEWDAPPEDHEIERVRIYVSVDGGSFQTLNNVAVPDGLIEPTLGSSQRWAAVAQPVPEDVPVELAVTAFDADGESGWNPIDAYYTVAGGPCYSGSPDAPLIVSIGSGAGSGEVTVIVTGGSADVETYDVLVSETGAGFTALETLFVDHDAPGPGDTTIVAGGADTSVAATYRIQAVDGHGNESSGTDRSCPPLTGATC